MAVHKSAGSPKVEIRKVKFSDFKDLVGQEIGVTDWFEITQQRVNAFAECTLDSQWIHTDEERAREESPYGGTISHGFLTLSLLSYFNHQLWEIQGAKTGINYGLNRVRFPSPVKVGSRLRARGELIEFKEIKDGIQYVLSTTVEIEGRDKPACVAEAVLRAHW